MKIKELVALVTGANRGFGQALVRALRDAGCAKVYAAARHVESVAPEDGIEPVPLDITNGEQVEAAFAHCGDVAILINNAGDRGLSRPALGAPAMDNARREMETNYFGTPAMCRAFAPVLKRNGGGALVKHPVGRELVQRAGAGHLLRFESGRAWSLDQGGAVRAARARYAGRRRPRGLHRHRCRSRNQLPTTSPPR